MPDHSEVVDAFTDTPQTEKMAPVDKADAETESTSTENLTVQGGE